MWLPLLQAESDAAALRAELKQQKDELQAARLEARKQDEEVRASQSVAKALTAEKAAAQASFEKAREALNGLLDEQKAAKARVAELERSCEEAASSGEASAKSLHELQEEHKQASLPLVLRCQRACISLEPIAWSSADHQR